MALFKQTVFAFDDETRGNSHVTEHLIFTGDSRLMKPVPDAAVQIMVTSPPYWQIKDYDEPDQIGRRDDFGAYIDNLNMVWAETARALMPGGVAAVNIGDQYARAAEYGRFKVVSIQSEIIHAFERLGLDYRGTIIWQKVTNTATSGGGAMMGTFPYPPGGVPKFDYEYILLFKKPGAAPKRTKEIKEASKLTPEEWKDFFTGHWVFPPERQTLHPAPFPPELPARLIKMFSFAGDTVLDPFIGSGTTALAAATLGRNSIGFDVAADFCDIASDRVRSVPGAKVSINNHSVSAAELVAARDALPFRCDNYIRLVRRPDDKIKKKQAPQLVRVKNVLPGFIVELSDGGSVHLAGVKTGRAEFARVAAFITEKAKRGVFCKQDMVTPEWKPGVPNVYLVAANKTNINWHLLREGLCGIDLKQNFKQKEAFAHRLNVYNKD